MPFTIRPARVFFWTLLSAALLPLAPAAAHPGHGVEQMGEFRYDKAERKIEGTRLDDDLFYDADILAGEDGGPWLAWLHFTPEEGDRIWVGRRDRDSWAHKRKAVGKAGRYAHPTLTRGGDGNQWLSYEAYDAENDQWDVMLRRLDEKGKPGEAIRVSAGAGNDINHSVASGAGGELWIAWQGDREGQFDVMGRRVSPEGKPGKTSVLSDSPRGDWHPAIASDSDGHVSVAWDSYDGDSYNILARRGSRGRWGPIRAVASGPPFQGEADVAIDGSGRTFVLWEEGSKGWGEVFRGRRSGRGNINDAYGPMHLHRRLRIASLEEDGKVRPLAAPLPMPALEVARHRPNRREGIRLTGTYYEGGKLAFTGDGRLWVAYRHFYLPEVGYTSPIKHHIEKGWRLYARSLDGDQWSDLVALTPHQRDGMQRLSISPTDEGLALAWTTGRTDRHKNDTGPRGVNLAALNGPGGDASPPKRAEADRPEMPQIQPIPERPEPARMGDKTYRLFFGDLHRHTDLSLCFPFFDGTPLDAYRYAIDAARLDFLGITDHTRDIARGDPLSHLWWRSTKEVTRHRLRDTFFPFFSYERSGGPADHNVISLRDDMLARYQPPLTDFWAQIQHGDTFTIPHTPFRNKQLWVHQNDAKRPLMEIYQGFRDVVGLKGSHEAHDALDKGHHVGFIASSDHMSTRASYAGVWAPEADREKIFRSMQQRRTFGATDKIRLIFRSGEHWMGERFTARSRSAPRFTIDVRATAPIQTLEIYRDGQRVAQFDAAEDKRSFHDDWRGEPLKDGKEHYYYVYVRQRNTERAWSSPIWITAGEEALSKK